MVGGIEKDEHARKSIDDVLDYLGIIKGSIRILSYFFQVYIHI